MGSTAEGKQRVRKTNHGARELLEFRREGRQNEGKGQDSTAPSKAEQRGPEQGVL